MKKLREELQKAREAAQLAKEAAKAEKQAVYMLGVEETQARLTEELSAVCREYCDISWGKALDVARVLVDSDLRRPKSIYYDPEIRELSSPDSSYHGQAKYLRNQRRTKSLLLPWKFQKTPTKMVAKERRLKLSRARIKVKIRRKILLIPQRKSQILLSLSPAKLLTQRSPKRKLRLGGFYYFYMFSVVVFCLLF